MARLGLRTRRQTDLKTLILYFIGFSFDWIEPNLSLQTECTVHFLFVRIAVDWLLRSDIGEVIKTIVADEAGFTDYAMPKESSGHKKKARSKRTKKR